jgi:Protein of unknown function (DUF3795)
MPEDHLKKTSYCGLYCGDCAFRRGTIPDLARDLRKELRDNRFDKVAEAIPFPEFKKYPDCYEVLGAMVKLRCKGCRGGSRSGFCNIAKCAIGKGFDGCWECDAFSDCRKLDFLATVHGDAHLKNLRAIKRVGVQEWAEGKRNWYTPARKK